MTNRDLHQRPNTLGKKLGVAPWYMKQDKTCSKSTITRPAKVVWTRQERRDYRPFRICHTI